MEEKLNETLKTEGTSEIFLKVFRKVVLERGCWPGRESEYGTRIVRLLKELRSENASVFQYVIEAVEYQRGIPGFDFPELNVDEIEYVVASSDSNRVANEEWFSKMIVLKALMKVELINPGLRYFDRITKAVVECALKVLKEVDMTGVASESTDDGMITRAKKAVFSLLSVDYKVWYRPDGMPLKCKELVVSLFWNRDIDNKRFYRITAMLFTYCFDSVKYATGSLKQCLRDDIFDEKKKNTTHALDFLVTVAERGSSNMVFLLEDEQLWEGLCGVVCDNEFLDQRDARKVIKIIRGFAKVEPRVIHKVGNFLWASVKDTRSETKRTAGALHIATESMDDYLADMLKDMIQPIVKLVCLSGKRDDDVVLRARAILFTVKAIRCLPQLSGMYVAKLDEEIRSSCSSIVATGNDMETDVYKFLEMIRDMCESEESHGDSIRVEICKVANMAERSQLWDKCVRQLIEITGDEENRRVLEGSNGPNLYRGIMYKYVLRIHSVLEGGETEGPWKARIGPLVKGLVLSARGQKDVARLCFLVNEMIRDGHDIGWRAAIIAESLRDIPDDSIRTSAGDIIRCVLRYFKKNNDDMMVTSDMLSILMETDQFLFREAEESVEGLLAEIFRVLDDRPDADENWQCQIQASTIIADICFEDPEGMQPKMSQILKHLRRLLKSFIKTPTIRTAPDWVVDAIADVLYVYTPNKKEGDSKIIENMVQSIAKQCDELCRVRPVSVLSVMRLWIALLRVTTCPQLYTRQVFAIVRRLHESIKGRANQYDPSEVQLAVALVNMVSVISSTDRLTPFICDDAEIVRHLHHPSVSFCLRAVSNMTLDELSDEGKLCQSAAKSLISEIG